MDRFSLRVADFIQRERLFTPHDRILVAVSGGVDSMVLLQVLHALDYEVGVVHVNYQLRGDDSDGDMDLVKKRALTLDAKFHGLRAEITGNRQADGRESLQMEARKIRYNYFEKILDEYKYNHVATAHHLDDWLETALINLSRSTGFQGLVGIQPKNGRTRRPLLNESRSTIETYARANKVPWRQDGSNATLHYLRNRIRHQVIPLLKTEGLTTGGISITTASMRGVEELLNEAVASRVSRASTPVGEQLSINITGLSETGVQTLVHRVATPFGFTAETIRQVLGHGTTAVSRDGKHRLSLAAGQIFIAPASASPDPIETLVIASLPFTTTANGKRYRLYLHDRPERLTSADRQYLSPLLIERPGPLALRAREPGDRIQPFGLGGRTKKIKDVLIDRKIPKHERPGYPLLVGNDGEVIAIAELMISELARVTSRDERVLVLEVTTG